MSDNIFMRILACGLVLCLPVFVSSAEVTENCKRLAIRAQETLCNPSLADVSTAILASDGKNYTHVCRCVEAYVQCMEPFVANCEPSRVYEYWNNKVTYTSEPYNCTPSLSTVRHVSQMTELFPPSLEKHEALGVSAAAGNASYRAAALCCLIVTFVSSVLL